MASECQRPTSIIVSESTLPQRSAIAPPARSDRALIDDGSMPVTETLWRAAKRSCEVTSHDRRRTRRLR